MSDLVSFTNGLLLLWIFNRSVHVFLWVVNSKTGTQLQAHGVGIARALWGGDQGAGVSASLPAMIRHESPNSCVR